MAGIEYIKTQKIYQIEELYQMIENCNFTAGKPTLKVNGPFKKINLPAVGKYCINIIPGGNRIQLTAVLDTKQHGEMVKLNVLYRIFGVFSGLFDKDKKPSYELLAKTKAELSSFLGL